MKRKSQSTPKAHKRRAPKTAWKPGQSGNPGGRPKTDPELVEAFRERTEKAVAVLDRAMGDFLRQADPPAPVRAAAVKASEVTLNRGWGTAPATVKLDVEGRIDTDAKTTVAVKVLDPERLTRVLGVLQQSGALDAMREQAKLPEQPEPETDDETKEEP